MRKFTNAISGAPAGRVDGITSAPELGKPDYELALRSFDAYIEALKSCGVEVTILPADERYPDSCFVEDPAVVTHKCAIVTNPGASSRNGEKWRSSMRSSSFIRRSTSNTSRNPGRLRAGT